MPTRNISLEKNKYYHIYNRGFEKKIIFKNKEDFERFIKTIIKYNKEFKGIKILSYSLLPNHFHFILTSNISGQEISNFMRKIQQGYAMYIKAKYSKLSPDQKIRGQFFEGRFKIKLINNDDYLYKCLAYVNFNSLKHKVVDNIDNYSWTSYHSLDNKNKINKYKDLILEELEF